MKSTICLLLIIGFATIEAKGQLVNSRQFGNWSGGLCDETIILDSTGYFFKERGCEGRSIISYGRYQLSKHNVIRFYSLPMDSLQPIREIKRYKSPGDSTLTITLYDRYDKPLSYAINLVAVDSVGRHYDVLTDEHGSVVQNRRLHRDLLVVPLMEIYGNQPPLVVGDETNIIVRFSLPWLFLAYQEIRIEQMERTQLIMKQDGLYTRDGKMKLYGIE
jgi:hypothetical protein